jgi:hypothetical protein
MEIKDLAWILGGIAIVACVLWLGCKADRLEQTLREQREKNNRFRG